MTDLLLLLLAKDEALIRLNLEEESAAAGFAQVVASNGRLALAEVAADGSRFRGIVTDIRLGKGPIGWDVTRRVRELVPGIPIIYLSSDSAHEWDSCGVLDSVTMKKPFVTVQVTTAISTLLN